MATIFDSQAPANSIISVTKLASELPIKIYPSKNTQIYFE